MAIGPIRFINRVFFALLFLISTITASITPFNSVDSTYAFGGECDYTLFESSDPPIRLYDPCYSQCTVNDQEEGTDREVGEIRDYKGRQIISSEQIATIQENKPVYEEAATEADIPWQMLAALHAYETGLSLEGPDDGTGLYNYGEGHSSGTVDENEFLEQSKDVATYLKSKALKPEDLSNDATKSSEAVKAAFYEFIGPKQAYAQQAKDLEFSRDYDGSPEVMNRVDSVRDSTTNPDTWGQIKDESGELRYPANSSYGLYPLYATISGIPLVTCKKSGEIIYYDQEDPRWAGIRYAWHVEYNSDGSVRLIKPGAIGPDGCGPTSMAMIIATLLGDPTITPDVVAANAGDQTSWKGGGTAWQPMRSGVLAKWGDRISVTTTLSMQAALDFVKSGKGYAWVGGSTGAPTTASNPPFTRGGHLVAIMGVTDDGKYIVANSYDRVFEQIDEISEEVLIRDGGGGFGVSLRED